MLSKIDKVNLIGNLLHIDNKKSVVVPFIFNKMQRHFHLNKGNRNLILKHRQGGMTSSILADQFTDCLFIPHTYCAVVSHETKATERLLDRVQFYYDSMLPPRPEIGAESRSEKTFPLMHSSMYVGTAGSRAFSRGDTVKKSLLSEVGFYEDGERIVNAMQDAVPLEGELDLESSPNGEDNILYTMWVKAREGKLPYKTFFYPWWWTEDYRIPRCSGLSLPEDDGELTYTPEEQELITLHSLDESQIRWRRWKIRSMRSENKGNLFPQEYIEDLESCWLGPPDKARV